jgi:phosphohistidine phosphatase
MSTMRVLVIRHARAVPQGAGVADTDRALTPEGRRRFEAVARGLARLVTPDALLTSPLLRARQTAAIAAAAWGGLAPTPEPALASGGVDEILGALENQPPDATVALVGHEPTVSMLVAELAGLSSSDDVAFEPGAAALLEWPSTARRRGRLVWFMSPADAAALGGVGESGALPPTMNQ